MNHAVLEVSILEFLNNIQKIEQFTQGKKVIPVIKANAYGTYIHQRLDVLNRFSIVAVANVKEAVALRKLGYEKEILVLNQPLIEDISTIFSYNIIVGCSSIEFIQKVSLPIRIHIEVETGMNRTGVSPKDYSTFIEAVKQNSNISVEGCYTHFSSADFDEDYTKRQMNLFHEAVDLLKKHFSLQYIHCSASSALGYLDSYSNYVRPGILLYGHQPSEYFQNVLVKPITTLKTKISFLKEVEKGEAIGYGQTFVTKKKMKIATIPIGYGDGYSRRLSNQGYVWVQNRKCPIVGNVCMDSCMIDVTDLPVSLSQEVILWDGEHILVEDIAKMLDTISYEVLCSLSSRVERRFV